MNVDTLYPYDVIRSMNQRGNASYAEAAWANLPDYYDRTEQRILPIIDTSGSMGSFSYYGRSSNMNKTNVTPMDIAISLGIYTAERNNGPFKNCVIPFSTRARFVQFSDKDSLATKVSKVRTGEVASTNLQAAFKLILDTAIKNKVPESDMPTHLLVISDMEFNQAVVMHDPDNYYRARMQSENFTAIEQMYRAAGYNRPKIIFWNVNGRAGNNPVSFNENNTAMVAGFSPAVVKAALTAKEVDPLEVMLNTVQKERYDF